MEQAAEDRIIARIEKEGQALAFAFNHRFDKLDERLDQIDQRLSVIEQRISVIEQPLA